jgi:AcrR family transcriptional regulator
MPRAYDSPRRARAAAETRTGILDAALQLFFENGYAATTVTDVAKAAEVAPNTVYVSVGGKPQLVLALIERGIDDPTIGTVMTEFDGMADGVAAVRLLVDGIRANYEIVYEVISVMYDAARAEPSIDEAARRAETYYRGNLEHAARHLRATEQLAPGLGVKEATERMWLLLGLHSWRVLRQLGWSWRKSERWLASQVIYAVLAPDE